MGNELTSTTEMVDVTLSGRVAVVALNRPESLNALNLQLVKELTSVLKEVSENEAIDIVVLKGNGRAFSSGGDIKMMLDSDHDTGFSELMDQVSELIPILYFMPKLTISVIHGAAAGLGLSIALATDYRIADAESKIAMNFVGIGLVPDGGGHYFLESNLGIVDAKALIWEGKVMKAPEALEKKLIDAVAEDSLDAAVEQKVQAWLNSPIQAMIASKKILTEKHRSQLMDVLKNEKEAQLQLRKTHDHYEGIHAFVEKRKPIFTGK